ncbi:glutathione S-transferase C-terminal-like protein [Pisolithus sp. B1]|nr:glutathione S-transferase C-terminal-like protein [Pisolithus sp. B1]
MTLIGKMYSHIDQPQAKVILSVAALSNLEIELLPFEYGVTNKSPEFTQKFPLAKIPAFESLDGFRLTEGVAIARYVSSLVPDAGLLGRSTKETALVDQWVHFAESEIHMDASMIYAGAGLKLLPGYNADLHKWHEERVSATGITLADVFLATAIQRVGQTICGAAEREQIYPHVFAHHAKVTSDARIKDVFGEPGFIEERLVCT